MLTVDFNSVAVLRGWGPTSYSFDSGRAGCSRVVGRLECRYDMQRNSGTKEPFSLVPLEDGPCHVVRVLPPEDRESMGKGDLYGLSREREGERERVWSLYLKSLSCRFLF